MDLDVASARMKEELVITITAPEKATQRHRGWVRPRGLEGGIIQVQANRYRLYSREVI